MTARVFRLPDLGEGLTEAALVGWLVAVGDEIAIDQPVAEVETAKSMVEVPSPFAGTVTALHGAAGDVLPVGAPLIEIGGDRSAAPASVEEPVASAGESPAPVEESAAPEERAPSVGVEAEAYRAEERAGSGNVLIGYGTAEAHANGRTRRRRDARPPARRDPVAAFPAAPAAQPAVSAQPAAVLSAPAGGPVAVRSPIVRRLAEERGVDLRTVTPTGPDGVITRADVERAAQGVGQSGGAHAASAAGVVRVEPLGMLRKAVGARMTRSRAEIPEATVWVDVDVTELWELRRAAASPPSFTAIIARFVVAALGRYPVLAARLSADGTALEYLDGVHLGVATDTERGLMVPVMRHAERLGTPELDAAIRAAGDAARAGTASPAELTGSTFTLNNYGTLGVDGSAAIINHPEVAILGVGRMIERPWVVDGAVVPRRICQVSLVFDHRVCDGGYAAGFLGAVVDAMEHPALFSLSV